MLKINSLTLKIMSALSALLFLQHTHGEQILSVADTYASGIFDESASEISAYDPETYRLFVSNDNNTTLDVFQIGSDAKLSYLFSHDLSSFGSGVNAVDVAKGKVAVAVYPKPKQNPGSVVIFDTHAPAKSAPLAVVPVGALPDHLSFTTNGQMIVVANEGEPDDDYTNDPNGTISIISINDALVSAKHLDFTAFDSRKDELLAKGVRIFGLNATVAQDLEPEYVAINEDDTKAFVTLQENNAFAVVDLIKGEILDVIPFGYKDHARGRPNLTEYKLNELIASWPSLGTPETQSDPVMLGGFSGLWVEPTETTDNIVTFYAVPDRGPNADNIGKADITSGYPAGVTQQNVRPFKLPDYQGRIVKFKLYRDSGKVFLVDNIMLTSPSGTPITGRGNAAGIDEVPVAFTSKSYPNKDYSDKDGNTYHALDYDPYGGDFEGILIDPEDKTFWMCDEYRPAIYQFDANGKMLNRYIASGTAAADSLASTSPGYYGSETLPAVYQKRRANRGFEGLALDHHNGVIYAFIQTPMYNPDSSTKNNSDVIRIVGISKYDGTVVAEYIYLLERNAGSGHSLKRTDKIGDAVYVGKESGDMRFLVMERDSSAPSDGMTGHKYVYEIDLSYATNMRSTSTLTAIADRDGTDGSKTLEQMTAGDLASAGIKTAFKLKLFNLPSLGYMPSDKPEGLAVLPDGSIAVINDNDFGLAGAGVSDTSSFGLISFDKEAYGFDATNKDKAFNPQPWSVLGMFQPDTIQTFSANGTTYLITANEGDARDYDGYSEETRVSKLDLSPNHVIGKTSSGFDPANLPDGFIKSHKSNVDKTFDLEKDLDMVRQIGSTTALIAEAGSAGSTPEFLQNGTSGDDSFPYLSSIKTLATMGEFDLTTGYPLTGYPDGQAAWLHDDNTIRIAYQSESYANLGAFGETYPWVMTSGVKFTGSHIHTIDYDRSLFADFLTNNHAASSMFLGSGHLYNKVYNVFGDEVLPKADGGKWGNQTDETGAIIEFSDDRKLTEADFYFQSFCGAYYEKANKYGTGIGFANDVWLCAEEWQIGSMFPNGSTDSARTMGLASVVVDIDSGIAYTAPALGQSGYEKLLPINPGHTDYVVIVCAGYNHSLADAPLKLYVGIKGKDVDGNDLPSTANARDKFLAANGLLYGKLYGLAVKNTDFPTSLNISEANATAQNMETYLQDANASNNFSARYYPTSYQWKGWGTSNAVPVKDTEVLKWTSSTEQPTSYTFLNGSTKTEHPAVDPDITKHRYIQNMTASGAILGFDFGDLTAQLTSASGGLPAYLDANATRIVAATEGSLTLDVGGHGLGHKGGSMNPDGTLTAAIHIEKNASKTVAPDGLMWIKAKDADILIVDEDSGNDYGERKFALMINPSDMTLTEANKGYFLAMAGGKYNPRALAGNSALGNSFAYATSSEFSGSWNVTALVAKKANGSFYTKTELLGSAEQTINQSVNINDSTIIGVLQHRSESGGPLISFRADAGGQIYSFSPNLPTPNSSAADSVLALNHVSDVNSSDSYLAAHGSLGSLELDKAALKRIGEVTGLIAEASTAGTTSAYLQDGQGGDTGFPFLNSIKALATVGEYDSQTGYSLTGYPDGQAAWLADENTIRVAYQSESYATLGTYGETYPWVMANGVSFTGSHIHTIDYDRAMFARFLDNSLPASSMFKTSGHLFDTVYNVFGDVVLPKSQGGLWGNQTESNGSIIEFSSSKLLSDADFYFQSFCGAYYEKKNKYGTGIGFADDAWLCAEEWAIGSMFPNGASDANKTMGLASLVVDVSSGVAYTVPALGQSGYEKLLPINPGHEDYVVIVCAGYNHSAANAPLKLYVGRKGVDENGSLITSSASAKDQFLARNGLLHGKLYGLAVSNADYNSSLGISDINISSQMMETYLEDSNASDTFNARYYPTSYKWAGWGISNAKTVGETEIYKWTSSAEQPTGYTFLIGNTKTEHPAVDPDITKHRYVQNMTASGAILGFDFGDLTSQLSSLSLNDTNKGLPSYLDVSVRRIVAATAGSLTLDVGTEGKGIGHYDATGNPNGLTAAIHIEKNASKTVAPDGLMWIKTADADVLIVDEDSGNDYGERKFALVLDPSTMALNEPNKGYFLALAGGSKNPRGDSNASVYPGTKSNTTSAEFSGSWNVTSMVTRKEDGTFYSMSELAGTGEQTVNSKVLLEDSMIIGVVQHRSQSGGVVDAFRNDAGGQVFAFRIDLPPSATSARSVLLANHVSDINSSKLSSFDSDVAKLKPIGDVTALIAEAGALEGNYTDGQSGDTDFPYLSGMKALATVGEYDPTTGYSLTGYPDGQAAWLVDNDTIRVAYQSESYATMGAFGETYPWVMTSGVSFTGSHIHTIDYDRYEFAEFLSNNQPASSMFKGSGHLFDKVYNVFGDEVLPKAQGGKWGNQTKPNGDIIEFATDMKLSDADFFFQSFCGAYYEKKNKYGPGIGFEDDIWLCAEEWNIGSMFTNGYSDTAETMGLASVVVDVANGIAYTAPALGQSGYEKIMPINSGHPDYVVIVCSGYNHGTEPAPLKVYIGRKGLDSKGATLGATSTARDKFLGRNGLLFGKLYGMSITKTELSTLLPSTTAMDQGTRMMDDYLKNASASDTFKVKYFPTSFQWKGWGTSNAVAVKDTEVSKWISESPSDSSYLFFNGDTKIEHPAVDPDITKFRYIQNMTDEGALLAITFTNMVQELKSAGGGLPKSLSADCKRIIAAVDGDLTLDVGNKGLGFKGGDKNADGKATAEKHIEKDVAKMVAPDGLMWIKSADADVLIVDEDSGNDYGERKYALVLDSDTLDLIEPNTGYFLAMAGGKYNPRSDNNASAYGNTHAYATSAEFSGSWNVSALIARKGDGSFYSMSDLAGTGEQYINQSININDSTIIGVIQHRSESGGPVAAFRNDAGGQVLTFSMNLPDHALSPSLQNDYALGRLKTTTATGDLDGDGKMDRIFSYGGRSFSIWDEYGNLVFDSGNQLEQIVFDYDPANFNATNDENGADDRSDDKGPEPEGLTVGKFGDKTFAFVGLERVGGVAVYDITNPMAPKFLDYTNNRDFSADVKTAAAKDLGPEGLVFIEPKDSPTGTALLVVSNEVSGTTTVYNVKGKIPVFPVEELEVFGTDSGIALTWKDTNSNETGYNIFRSSDGVSFSPLASINGSATSYVDATAVNGQSYTYRVEVKNANSQVSSTARLSAQVTTPVLEMISTSNPGIEDYAEIPAFDPLTNRVFVSNNEEKRLDVFEISKTGSITSKFSWSIPSEYGGINSVAVSKGVVAFCVEGKVKQNNGAVVMYATNGSKDTKPFAIITAGALPDHLSFSPDGLKLIVANEGEPSDDYKTDPNGSITVIDTSKLSSVAIGAATASSLTVTTLDFTAYNSKRTDLVNSGVRIFGPNATVAQDLEPEYVAVTADSKKAYVTLQENNALAVVDLSSTPTITDIVPLGYKDWAAYGLSLDATNEDEAFNQYPWPVLGMYQPDSIASFQIGGKNFLITANEGDARDYKGFSEEKRVKDLTIEYSLPTSGTPLTVATIPDGLKKAHRSNVASKNVYARGNLVDNATQLEDDLVGLKKIGEVTALIPEASTGYANPAYAIDGKSGNVDFPFLNGIKPIATVGEYDPVTGYPITGYPDGQAAWLADDDTIRVAYQSESYATMGTFGETYPWVMQNGVSFTGSHIHTIDYDRTKFADFLSNTNAASTMFKASGHLFDTVYNVFGELVDGKDSNKANLSKKWGNQTLPDGTVLEFSDGFKLSEADFFFQSFCGAYYEKANKYGVGIGFANDAWLCAEEWQIGSMFPNGSTDSARTLGLASVVVDVANGVAYTVPALGQSGYEKLLPINPGHKDYVVIVCAGYNHSIANAPLKVYVGLKGKGTDGNALTADANARDKFLAANGLLFGKLYGLAVKNEDYATKLKITDVAVDQQLIDTYLQIPEADDTFSARYYPTSFQWKGWGAANAVAVKDTEVSKWTSQSEQPTGYTFFNGNTKTEHPAVDPDITKHRYVQNMTNKGAIMGFDFGDLTAQLNAASGKLPSYLEATATRIVAAVDGSLVIQTGGAGVGHGGMSTAAEHIEKGVSKPVAPDGLMWVKSKDADVLIVDEDSGNDYGERKYALVLDPKDMTLKEDKTGYFLAQAGGKYSPRGAAKVSAYGGAYAYSTSSEFSGSWNVSALIAKKSNGSFYTKAELAGTKEQEVNSGIALKDTTVLGVLQHRSESGGPVAAFRADAGGQIFLFRMHIPSVSGAKSTVVTAATYETPYFENDSSYPAPEKSLSDDLNLGRLKTTSATGDTDGDGKHEHIYAYGARSFSIWDESGALVFDSGSDIERIVRMSTSDWGSSYSESRSDDKGPEPEGVAVGVVDGKTYAFIGLERSGGILVYDITNPLEPEFLQYANNSNDVSPEGLVFVSAEDSPTGHAILVVTNEVSGSTTVWGLKNLPVGDVQGLQVFQEADFTLLNWQDTSSVEDGFIIMRKEGSGDFKEIGRAGRNSTDFFDSQVAPGVTYTYTVKAYNGISESGSGDEVKSTSNLRLTILHASDAEQLMPTALSGGYYGGAGLFVTRMNELRAEYEGLGHQVLTITAGDNLMPGKELAASTTGNDFYHAMLLDQAGFEVATIGNHEFDAGPDVTANFIAAAKSPTFLSANLDFSAHKPMNDLYTSGKIAKSTTIDVSFGARSIRVGVVGAVTENLNFISSPLPVKINTKVAEAIQSEIDTLKSNGAQLIILSSHLQGISEELNIIKNLKDVDVVLSGGGGDLLANPNDLLIPIPPVTHWSGSVIEHKATGPYPMLGVNADNQTVPVVAVDGQLKYIGRLTLDVTSQGELVGWNGGINRVVDTVIDPFRGVVADPVAVETIEEPVNNFVTGLASMKISNPIDFPLMGSSNDIRAVETNLGNLVADAFLQVARKDAPLKGLPASELPNVAIANGGGIRDSINVGGDSGYEVTVEDTYKVLPFSNYLTVVPGLTSSEFKLLLENAYSRTVLDESGQPKREGGGTGRFAQIAGFTVEYDITAPAMSIDSNDIVSAVGSRVVNVTLNDGTKIIENGVPVDEAVVNLAIVDFLADGGDQYFNFKSSKVQYDMIGYSYQAALAEYISNVLKGDLSKYKTTDGRISHTGKASADGVKASSASGYFPGSKKLDGGWKQSTWFGTFWDQEFPWIYHAEHGWLYAGGTGGASMWFYDLQTGWWWTNEQHYPYVYLDSVKDWVFYQPNAESKSRFFYLFSDGGKWVNYPMSGQ